MNTMTYFEVLIIVHFSIILSIDQLNAQMFPTLPFSILPSLFPNRRNFITFHRVSFMERSYVTQESKFCKQITLQNAQSYQLTNLMHKFLFYNKFTIFLDMFRALLCSSSGGQIILHSIWYRHTL